VLWVGDSLSQHDPGTATIRESLEGKAARSLVDLTGRVLSVQFVIFNTSCTPVFRLPLLRPARLISVDRRRIAHSLFLPPFRRIETVGTTNS
jgi:hypothetical protein